MQKRLFEEKTLPFLLPMTKNNQSLRDLALSLCSRVCSERDKNFTLKSSVFRFNTKKFTQKLFSLCLVKPNFHPFEEIQKVLWLTFKMPNLFQTV